MNSTTNHPLTVRHLVLWLTRICGVMAIVPLMLIVFGERGTGPSGVREWVYLALFPFGFSVGYLLGWRWPVVGGCVSLACMATSLIVIGRVFDAKAYLIWGVLCIPGILFVVAGWNAGISHKTSVPSGA